MRTYKRKTERGKTPKGVMLDAVSAVVKGKQSVRKTALDFNIPRKTLSRYVNKFIENGGSEGNVPKEEIEVGYVKYRQVFPRQQEEYLGNYLKKAADIYYGEVRKLAFQYAVAINAKKLVGKRNGRGRLVNSIYKKEFFSIYKDTGSHQSSQSIQFQSDKRLKIFR